MPAHKKSPVVSKSKMFDAVIALGKNIGEGWGPAEIKEQRFHLSNHARITVLAAGMIYQQGLTDKLIFSSGESVRGYNEAKLMRTHLKYIFGDLIPDEAIILEKRSLNTKENAEEVKRIIDKYEFKKLALLTVGFHLERADMLFKKAGLDVEDISSEDIIAEKFPEFTKNYKNSPSYQQEIGKEKISMFVQSIPIAGALASKAVSIKRSLNT